MSYRKITVNGVEHQYTVGKTHVKVRGMQAVPKKDVGSLHDAVCECCGEPAYLMYGDPREYHQVLRVLPSDVAHFIEHAG